LTLIVQLVIVAQLGIAFWFKTGVVLLSFAGQATPPSFLQKKKSGF
jgi:hypothetical protein